VAGYPLTHLRTNFAGASPADTWREYATLSSVARSFTSAKMTYSPIVGDDDADALRRHLLLLNEQGILSLPITNEAISSALETIEWHANHGDPWDRYLAKKRIQFVHQADTCENEKQNMGNATWSEIRRNPGLSRDFDRLMISRSASGPMLDGMLQSGGILVDVGGGPGHYALSVMNEVADIQKAIIIDSYIDVGWFALGVGSPAVEVINGDFITMELPMADLYLLGSILHNLPDPLAILLLKKCADSGIDGSRALIIERAFNPLNLRDSGRDLDMRALFGGKERTFPEVRDLLHLAGYRLESWRTLEDGYRVMVARAIY
jgi:O-methyltransferase